MLGLLARSGWIVAVVLAVADTRIPHPHPPLPRPDLLHICVQLPMSVLLKEGVKLTQKGHGAL
jgi:hypothetical protein